MRLLRAHYHHVVTLRRVLERLLGRRNPIGNMPLEGDREDVRIYLVRGQRDIEVLWLPSRHLAVIAADGDGTESWVMAGSVREAVLRVCRSWRGATRAR